MAKDYVLANINSANFTLLSYLDYYVPQSEVGNNVKRDCRSANRRDRDKTSLRLSNDVQLCQTVVLPQKLSVYKVREEKR